MTIANRRWRALSCPLPLCLLAPLIFLRPQPIPAERIIKNLEGRIARLDKRREQRRGRRLSEDLASLHYKLARVHYLALINQSTLVPGFEHHEGGPEPADDHLADGFVSSLRYDEATRRAKKALGIDERTTMDRPTWQKLAAERKKQLAKLQEAGWRPPPPDEAELHRHAEQAMVHFDAAIGLLPAKDERARRSLALYQLGRASLAEQALDLERADKLPKRAMLKPLAGWSYEKARDAYWESFELASEADLRSQSQPIEGLSGFVSHEAGQGFLRITKKVADLGEGQGKRVEKVRESLRQLGEIPPGPITPILIGGGADAALADLLDPHATVVFDLDGDGVAERWPWVCRDTRILVWDPSGAGEIRSGRQLFGSVTFFLFHRDGYRALSLLDDDLDGELTGLELDGIAVWTDRNGDGESSADEVEPAFTAGIRRIRTEVQGGVRMNRRGLVYEDGRAVPTFDWITAPR